MIDRLTRDLAAYLVDAGVWWSVLVASALGLALVAIGVLVARRTGLIDQRAGTSETISVGLALGLVVVAAGYAALKSGAASSYTPVFVVLMAAVALGRGSIRLRRPGRGALLGGLACLAMIVLVGMVFGITISPSPRDGVQPIEFMDEPFYAVLGAQLQRTGIESAYLPAGFGPLPGLPERSWYHWGEAWLSAVVLELPGISAMQARHLVVLPLLILSSACMVGSLASRLVRPEHRAEAFFLGAFGMTTIGPVPLLLGEHFDWWARPIGFGITLYGLAFVVVLLGIHVLLRTTSGRTVGETLAIGSIAGALVASHVLVAATGAVAVGVAGLTSYGASLQRSWRVVVRDTWQPVVACATVGLVTITWGFLSGHGFGQSGAVAGVTPLSEVWQRAVVLVVLGGGILVIGPIVAVAQRRRRPRLAALGVGAGAAVLTGALIWGIRLADFNSFHIFYGAIAVLLTPIAVVATIVAAIDARDRGRARVAKFAIVLLLVQGGLGIGATMQRLYEFGPGHYEPMPVAALEFIRNLPPDAKIAYSCAVQEEVAPWDARLISVTAHTGRPVVPMCFQADVFGHQLGVPPDPAVESPFFRFAPQRQLYSSLEARPSEAEIADFLSVHGISYILVDRDHPNRLVADARPVFSDGVTILELR